MILAAILILCKLEGQDVKIILVSAIFGFSIPKLTYKVIDTTFSHICTSDVPITEMDLV